MSYKLPFSDPAGRSVIRVILLALIGLHGAWIVIHMNLVSRELINPWKLGGYGMYTTTHPSPALYLFDRRFDGFEIPSKTYDLANFERENKYFIFRCRPITATSLQTFFNEHARFVGIPLKFVVTERKILRNPIRLKRVPQANLIIRWTGKSAFEYVTKVCGEVYRGEVELKS